MLSGQQNKKTKVNRTLNKSRRNRETIAARVGTNETREKSNGQAPQCMPDKQVGPEERTFHRSNGSEDSGDPR